VELSLAAKVPISAIGQVMRGEENENSLEVLRVLDIILRQHSVKQYVTKSLHGKLYLA
jgi:eukaryotic translation initiation factor 2C